MSRRKQSNPKSIKRKSEDELEEIALVHHLPTDTLHLKQTDEQTNGQEFGVYATRVIVRGTVVGRYKAREVQVGSDNPHHFNCLLETTQKNGCSSASHIAIDEESGHWIKLLQLSSDSVNSNFTVTLTDSGHVVCTVTKDIAEETQLIAMLTRDIELDLAGSPAVASPPHHSHLLDKDMVARNFIPGSNLPANCTILHANFHLTLPDLTPEGQRDVTPEGQKDTSPSLPSPPLCGETLACAYCGLPFTSYTTLHAHETVYCSKRPLLPLPQPQFPSPALAIMSAEEHARIASYKSLPDLTGHNPLKRKHDERKSSSEGAPRVVKRQKYSSESDKDSAHESASVDSEHDDIKAKKLICPHCTFKGSSTTELENHLRLHFPEENHAPHASSPKQPSLEPQGLQPGKIPVILEMYCKECEIQFTSMSTYKGHKEHYCQQRRRSVTKKDADRTASPRRASPARASPKPVSPAQAPYPFPMLPHAMSMTSPPVMPSAMMPQAIPSSMVTSPSIGLNPAMFMASPMLAAAYNMPLIPPILPPMPRPVNAHQPPPTSGKNNHQPTKPKPHDENPDQPLDLTLKKDTGKQPNRADSAPASVIVIEPEAEKTKANSPGRTPPRHASMDVNLPVPPPEALVPPHALSVIPLLHQQQAAMMMSQSPQHQQPHMSKCMDCNIVFYKHENFVAHKEHYCASRRGTRTSSESSTTIPSRSPASATESPHSPRINKTERLSRSPARSISPATQAPSPASSKSGEADHPAFFCQSCKIKFSSPDNLKAHQNFYCPGRSQDANKPKGGQGESDSGDSASLTCLHCHNTFGSARLLKLHYCTGTSMHLPLFHCPYCDYIAQSDSRLVEHIKAHAPSKAYKCALCGYRGNTVRGMRMHGKMHIDNGENFTDEHMLEFEEPPLIPKTLRNDSGPVDWEGELLRLKCEPYKRRRSRKGYEKAEYMTPQRQEQRVCVDCNSVFDDSATLLSHMQTHLAPETSNFRCNACEFVAESAEELKVHNKRKHDEDERGKENSETKPWSPKMHESRNSSRSSTRIPSPTLSDKTASENNNNVSVSNKSNATMRDDNKVNDKSSDKRDDKRTTEPCSNGVIASPPVSPNRPVKQHDMASILNKTNLEKTSRHCKQCDISFTYLSTFVAHKKYYCSSHAHERSSCQS